MQAEFSTVLQAVNLISLRAEAIERVQRALARVDEVDEQILALRDELTAEDRETLDRAVDITQEIFESCLEERSGTIVGEQLLQETQPMEIPPRGFIAETEELVS